MSKSSSSPQGIVDVLDEPDVIRKKIARAVTDAGFYIRADEAAKPGVTNLLRIYSALAGVPVAEVEACARLARGTAPSSASSRSWRSATFTPIRERTEKILADEAELDRLLAAGAARAGPGGRADHGAGPGPSRPAVPAPVTAVR